MRRDCAWRVVACEEARCEVELRAERPEREVARALCAARWLECGRCTEPFLTEACSGKRTVFMRAAAADAESNVTSKKKINALRTIMGTRRIESISSVRRG